MRKQYNFYPGTLGLDAWDVDRLIELSRDLPVIEVALRELTEIDANYWGLHSSTTVREVAAHVKLVNEVDLRYPIILAASGRVMDGMHRIVRSLIEGRATILARQFAVDPEPDYRDADPATLSYEET